MLTIAIDGMGGDFAPSAVVDGVKDILDASSEGYRLALVGDGELLEQELSRAGILGHSRLEIVHCGEVVDMAEKPASAIRSKRNSSINVAVDLVKNGRADAVVSAGNTGASVASTVLKLRKLPGIDRPAIPTFFPMPRHPFVLLDAGSTVDCKPLHLVHYAVMGEVYVRHLLGIENPRVGLLNVGAEAGKGNELTKATFELLSQLKAINFVGNTEGNDLFSGAVDVAVCDGFVGNVVLKCCEGLAHALGRIIRQSLRQNLLRRSGAFLARSAFRELHELSDHAEQGGAPLLGVRGICVIAHGSSSPKAIGNAVLMAGRLVKQEVIRDILERFEETGLASE